LRAGLKGSNTVVSKLSLKANLEQIELLDVFGEGQAFGLVVVAPVKDKSLKCYLLFELVLGMGLV